MIEYFDISKRDIRLLATDLGLSLYYHGDGATMFMKVIRALNGSPVQRVRQELQDKVEAWPLVVRDGDVYRVTRQDYCSINLKPEGYWQEVSRSELDMSDVRDEDTAFLLLDDFILSGPKTKTELSEYLQEVMDRPLNYCTAWVRGWISNKSLDGNIRYSNGTYAYVE